ncbi:hypothetical protein D3C85_646050 [compost metagenome]
MPEQITAWLTDDGELFTSRERAEQHEQTQEAKAELRRLVRAYCYTGMTDDEVEETLIKHAAAFASCLSKL